MTDTADLPSTEINPDISSRTRRALADARTDFTARVELTGLPADQAIFYRVYFKDAQSGVASEPWLGHLRSAPKARRNIRFVWSGDTVGQGFGINPDIGGMRIYESMRLRLPDFFIHSGDTIYAESLCTDKRTSKSRPDFGIISMNTRALNQDGDIVMTYDRSVMIPTRASGIGQDYFPEAKGGAMGLPTS